MFFVLCCVTVIGLLRCSVKIHHFHLQQNQHFSEEGCAPTKIPSHFNGVPLPRFHFPRGLRPVPRAFHNMDTSTLSHNAHCERVDDYPSKYLNIFICAVQTQGSYRNLTVVFQTFPGQNYSFLQTFQDILFIFRWTKTLQNWPLNAEISYTLYFSILNTDWDSKNFWTQMLCVMNCKKIYKCTGNQQCHRHLQVSKIFLKTVMQHYSLQDKPLCRFSS